MAFSQLFMYPCTALLRGSIKAAVCHSCFRWALLHGSKINKKPVIAKPRSGCGNPGYPECNEGFN
ncbi:hypothetical protein [Rickettsia endosymbiont of Ceutorhynchus obstrictus]|uniref:hypothetical protein n=1 Tax=Rickettsia endosymbiont of Ceutorhynchus obstrictus TaxID=3066249 RepID=UPI003132B3B3